MSIYDYDNDFAHYKCDDDHAEPNSEWETILNYDDEIMVNFLFSGISSDGSIYTIVANDISYDGDNIEDFKADLDQVFDIK